MSHEKRAKEAKALLEKLQAMPFLSTLAIFDRANDEWDTGKRCWTMYDSGDWHIVIQDDAIISENFYDNVVAALSKVPSKSMVSFYTGKVKPFPSKVTRAVMQADVSAYSWLRANNLLWGVCVAIPTDMVEPVLESAEKSRALYDKRLGTYFNRRGLPIYYSYPSLVDHDDSLPSLTNHHIKKRVAHNYEPGLVTNWNSGVIDIGV